MNIKPASIIAILIISGLIIAAESFATYKFIEDDPRFCKTCHLMEHAWNKWNQSPHKGISCHQCHVASVQDNMRLLVTYFTLRPVKISDKVHVNIPNKRCEECHFTKSEKWPYVAETAGHKLHLEKARANCIDCHGGRIHKFLPEKTECMKCHPDSGMKVKQMDFHCTNCHNFLANVNKSGENILPHQQDCRRCHTNKTIILALPEGAHATSDCSNCHHPHETAEPLPCETCHTPPPKPIHEYHKDKACTSCHVPHKQIGVRAICESCHTDRTNHYPYIKCTLCHK